MATLRTKIRVGADGNITGKAEGVVLPPGQYEATITTADRPKNRERKPLPVFHVGPWPEDLPLRREDMYSDDGR